jgi:hypothetical protein
VDTGYVDGPLLTVSQLKYGVELLGPTRADYQWQAREHEGFAANDFTIDWQNQQAICPRDCRSVIWTPAKDRSARDVIKIKFASADCGACKSQKQSTRSKRARCTLTIRPEPQYVALQAARLRRQRGILKTIQITSWYRGHNFARSARIWIAPRPLLWASQNASPTCHHINGYQPGANSREVRRKDPRHNPNTTPDCRPSIWPCSICFRQQYQSCGRAQV